MQNNPATPAEQRIFVLSQILHGNILCNPDAFKHNSWMQNKLRDIRKSIDPVMNYVERRVSEENIEGMYDEQRVTSLLISAIIGTSHEQRVEILKALETAGIVK